jgi:hypothetical protein
MTTHPEPTATTDCSALDHLIATPRLVERDQVDIAAPAAEVWERLRHGELAPSPLVQALFALRTLPDRLAGRSGDEGATGALRLEDLRSSPAQPGFQILVDRPPHEVAVGAIGQVWKPQIPLVDVPDTAAFAAFREPGYVKVAWVLRLTPRPELGASMGELAATLGNDQVAAMPHTRVELELRVDTTDDAAWRKFRRYFRIIGPASRFIRRLLLASLDREFGTPAGSTGDDATADGENHLPLPGDGLLSDAVAQMTHGITIHATPEAIWPWLVQMGCRRAGFYSVDLLDNGNVRSARELHPALQQLAVGAIIPATPAGPDGFEVLAIDAPQALVLGGLYDADAKRQLPFSASRPEHFWQVTWAFALEPIAAQATRLRVRVRGAYPASGRWHALWTLPVHHFMETAQLRHLAARAEGRVGRDDWRDVLEGISGAATMAAMVLTPFLRPERSHWGLDEAAAMRPYPGDELVPEPRWSWTHGVEIAASPEEVWPWVAQIGVGKAGFYSYQWLENLAGCALQNAERIHPEWAVQEGDQLIVHPKMPGLLVAKADPGHWFVAYGPPDAAAQAAGKPWIAASWLFFIEPLGQGRSRLISRYRCACSDDLATRLQFGATVVEPIGFTMDRRMLLGVKERVERDVPMRGAGEEPAQNGTSTAA